jgi:hypothetical protein
MQNEGVLAPRMVVEVDASGKAFVTYDACPECRLERRVPAEGLTAGATLTCPCGETTIDLTGDDLDMIQKLIDGGTPFSIEINLK